MGIQVEFNPDLALRAFRTPERLKEECLPEKLESEKEYPFLKKRSKKLLVTRRNSLTRNKRKSTIVKTSSKHKNIISNSLFKRKETIYKRRIPNNRSL